MKKERMCASCRKVQDSTLMYQIRKDFSSDKLFFNPPSKILGRSVYVCKNKECIKLFLKKKCLERTFKNADTAEIEAILKNLIVEDK